MALLGEEEKLRAEGQRVLKGGSVPLPHGRRASSSTSSGSRSFSSALPTFVRMKAVTGEREREDAT